MQTAAARESVELTLEQCRELALGEGVRLGDLVDRLGRAGFCFAALLLAAPFVQPFSLGPLTMIGGLTFILLGWQMGTGHEAPALPAAVRDLKIHGAGWAGVLGFCLRLVAWARRFTRVRAEEWVSGDRGERLVGWLILCGGALLAVPLASVPFNNTLPAMMIVFACIGWLERDGMMVIVSLAWGLATLIYFALLGVALLFFGAQIFAWVGRFWPF